MRVRAVTTCLMVAVIVGLASMLRESQWIGWLFVLATLTVLSALGTSVKDRRLTYILLLAMGLRLGLAILDEYIVALPSSTKDAVVFEEIGWETAEQWLGQGAGPESVFLAPAYSYRYLIASLYYLFGRVRLIPVSVNVTLGVLTVYLIYRICLKLGLPSGRARSAALLGAVFPTLNLYSVVLLRESIIVFSLAASMDAFLSWVKTGRILSGVAACALSMPACILHGAVLAQPALFVLVFCFYRPRPRRWSISPRGVLLAVCLGTMIVVALRSGAFSKLGPRFDQEQLQSGLETAARSRAAYLAGVVPSSGLEVALQSPLRIAYFLFAPFPWMMQTVGDVVGVVDSLLYVVLALGILRSLRRVRPEYRTRYTILAIVAFVLVLTFAWGTSNYGTAIRHRQKAVWLLIPLAFSGTTGTARASESRVSLGALEQGSREVSDGAGVSATGS